MTDRTKRFEAAVLPHLNAAYNLARWLLRNDQDARDVVQEAHLRAFRFFDGMRDGDARPWLLGVVRNACYTWLSDRGRGAGHHAYDDERDGQENVMDSATYSATDSALHVSDPERLLLQKIETARIDAAIATLPFIFREVLILREFEEMSYEEISQVAVIPVGTVMSRLARARAMLRATLTAQGEEN